MGVAPALAVVYVVGGWLRSLIWGGPSGSKKAYGGRKHRRGSFYAIRYVIRTITSEIANSNIHFYSRVERLLTQAPASSGSPSGSTAAFNNVFQSQTSFEPPTLPLDAKTHGHLMISLTSLRRYAEQHLPKRSAQREAFLDDLADLENAQLSKDDKIRVVQRMWRSWGGILGWGSPRFA